MKKIENLNKHNYRNLIKTFINLVKIESPSLKEKKIINYLKNELKNLGLELYFQKVGETGNLVAKLKGKKNNSFFLNAHIDTVEPCYGVKPIITDTLIKSDGKTILGGDDKAALAIFIELIKFIKKHNIPTPDIYFVLTYGEEIGLVGAKNFDFSLLKAKYGFSFDADGSPGTIILSAPTHYLYEIKVYGKSAHAGIEPEKGLNAIKIAADIINNIPMGKIDFETTANVGKIEGGIATNIVPDFVQFNGEVRSRNKIKLKNYIKNLKELLNEKSRKYKTKIEYNFNLAYKGYKFNENSFLVKKLKEACEICNLPVKYVHSNGGSDANIFNQNGFPTLNLGIGMQNVHSKNEFILIKDLINSFRLAVSIVNVLSS